MRGLIDLTSGAPPRVIVHVECPVCHERIALEEVEFGERLEEEVACEVCGRPVSICVELSVEFSVEAPLKHEGGR